MKGYIDALVNYALERGLIQEGDEIWAYNRLLEVLGLDEAEGEPVEAELAEILDKLTDDAVRRGIQGDLTAGHVGHGDAVRHRGDKGAQERQGQEQGYQFTGHRQTLLKM